MSTETTLTKTELRTVGLCAASICGCLWDDVDGDTVVAKLQAVLASRRPGGDADLTDVDMHNLKALLSLTDEAVYMLTDADTNDEIRDATVAEVCESLLAGPEGFITVDGRQCYVQTAVSY